jgi:hypothetical protein
MGEWHTSDEKDENRKFPYTSADIALDAASAGNTAPTKPYMAGTKVNAAFLSFLCWVAAVQTIYEHIRIEDDKET